MRVGGFEIEPLLVLLVFVPIAIALEFMHADPVWIFVASSAAIIPLAGLMGKATEHLAEKLGAPVEIQHASSGKGKVVVSYHSLDELDGILAHIR